MPISVLHKPTPSTVDSIQIDVSPSQQHSGDVDVTEHPVEQGSDISDNARPKQKQLTFEGFFTDTPIPGRDPSRIGQLQEGRSANAYQVLAGLRDSGSLVSVVTGLKTYQNMVITALTVPIDARTGDALRFSISFRAIRIVESQVDVHPATPRGKKKDKGTKPTTPAQPQVKKSVLDVITKDAAPALKKFFTGLFTGSASP